MIVKTAQELPVKGRLIGLDFGSKTIGIAISDGTRTIATPGKTLIRQKWGKDKLHFEALIKEYNIVGAVIGLPLSMDGSHSSQTDACIAFANMFATDLNLPSLMWDERLTTKSAESALFEQRTGRQKRASKKDVKAKVDSVAAAMILQGTLDQLSFKMF